MTKAMMINSVLDDEQLSTVAGGCRVERDELKMMMAYDPDFKKYTKRYGDGDAAVQNFLSDKVGINSRLYGDMSLAYVINPLGKRAEYWDDSGKKYTHKEVMTLLRKKIGLDV
jgi:hypothetical protein